MSIAKVIAQGWALTLPIQFVDTLFPLRLFEHIEVAEADADLWLRGRNAAPAVLAILASIPASQRFSWLAQDHLLPAHSRFATHRFPQANWQPLSKWLQPVLPIAALPAKVETKQLLQLAPSVRDEDANAILARSQTWAQWAAQAPSIRLKPLKFAAAESGRVLVIGLPLPTIAGRRMTARDGIITPAGLTWTPNVSPVTVREILGIGPESYILWEESGVQILTEEFFLPASRSTAPSSLRKKENVS